MRKAFIFLIDLYQKFISPLFPRRCRFYPTCSAYAKEAFSRFGMIGGLLLTIKRIVRCNPFCKGGIDYVPDNFLFFKRR